MAALILALAPIPKDAPTNPAGIVTAKMWAALAQCETGSNLAHNTRSYISALGMAKGTFNNWGGTRGDTRSWLRTMEVAERVAWYCQEELVNPVVTNHSISVVYLGYYHTRIERFFDASTLIEISLDVFGRY